MPLTVTSVTHSAPYHGTWRGGADENDLARQVLHLALGQSRHVAAIFADIYKKGLAILADVAKGTSTLRLSAPLPFVFGEPAC